jgi:hypothetical protein
VRCFDKSAGYNNRGEINLALALAGKDSYRPSVEEGSEESDKQTPGRDVFAVLECGGGFCSK